jgi:hypothetical protein
MESIPGTYIYLAIVAVPDTTNQKFELFFIGSRSHILD